LPCPHHTRTEAFEPRAGLTGPNAAAVTVSLAGLYTEKPAARPRNAGAPVGRSWPVGARLSLLVLSAGLLVLAGCSSEVSRWHSPDGRFEAVLYQTPSLSVGMPGSGSDGPGALEIVRVADGARCGRAPLEMRAQGYEVEFDRDHAHVKLVADWDLRACAVTLAGPH